MNIVSAFVAYVGEFERRRRFRQTERLIGSLPAEVRKDIGWPGAPREFERQQDHSNIRPAAC